MLSNAIVDVLKLDQANYALISPNKIMILSGLFQKDIDKLIAIELKRVRDEIKKENKYKSDKENLAITFLPTMDCNLRCIYCYAKGGEEKRYLTKKVAKDYIDYFVLIRRKAMLKLHFAGGGEPFLNFDVMKFIVNYSKQLFPQINIGLVTNGTFNSEQLKWIIDNNISLRRLFGYNKILLRVRN